jgi:hypothetical protein
LTRTPPDSWESKLADEELRRLSAKRGPGTLSVIVQLELPRPRVEMGRSERGGVGALRPRRVETESESEQRSLEDLIARARAFLEQLLGKSPVWLGAARAFGVEASGDQLRAIARSPLVRRIYLSRLRR